ncbi:hypothetical protein L218DRAFT_952999 [Marasmius fiardii PR-910]|nr:hypothetical protein L218DRAFT_952999 [Marasmius fiardii PR-910]
MPAVRGTTNFVLGESPSRIHRDRMRRNQSSPQYLQSLRTPTPRAHRASVDQTVAQPRRRNLTLWEVHAKTIKRRQEKFRKEELRRIASSLPMAVVNLQSPNPFDNTSKIPQHTTDKIIEETPTEPDEETRTEVATEIDDATSEREELGDHQSESHSDTEKDTGESTERNVKSEKEQALQKQAESFLRDVIGLCVEPPMPKIDDGEAKAQETNLHLNSRIQPRTAPEFVQGSSRDGQVQSENRMQPQTDKVRNWLDFQSSSQTERMPNPTPVYHSPHPTSQPSIFCTPTPMDTIPDLNNYYVMDTSPDPEELGVFTASDFIPPQPMQGVVVTPATSASNAPSETGPYRALSNPFAVASTLHPQWHSYTTDMSTSLCPLLIPAIPLVQRSDDEPALSLPSDGYSHWTTGLNGLHSNPFLNASRSQSQFQTEQPTSSSSSSAFDNYLSSNPFLVPPPRQESYHESPPSGHWTTYGQMFPHQQPLLSERFPMVNQGVEEPQGAGSSREKERETKIEPFIIEPCEEQEAWWDGISEWLRAKKSRSHWDFSPRNRVPVLDVTRPAHIRVTWRNISIRNASSSVDNTVDVTRSLENFDELLKRRVDTEMLRRSYLCHSKMITEATEGKATHLPLGEPKAQSPHLPAKLQYVSPYSFSKLIQGIPALSFIEFWTISLLLFLAFGYF